MDEWKSGAAFHPQAAREGLAEVAVEQVETQLGLAWATGCLLFGLMVGGKLAMEIHKIPAIFKKPCFGF